ncbi:MAG TPA: aspartate carbamoyltransferase catalytic subunit [Firmicutes bacterium]|nr:aspartate carbamoyltransferase catalytic subunit [Bacillota bacterium]
MTLKEKAVRHLITMDDLTSEEIMLILEDARNFKEVLQRDIKKVPALRGKTVVLLFFEASTRTKISFELAAKRLSADVVNFSTSTSSLKKSESLKDTVRTIEAMAADIFVMRHTYPGSTALVAKYVKGSVLNGGDGAHSHPTQALLDMYTIYEKKKRFKDLKVAIIGDIKHSRVVRSNIEGLTRMGANVIICGPATLLPRYIEQFNVGVTYNVEEAVKDADVVMGLRIQFERQEQGLFPSVLEYSQFFQINRARLRKAKPDVLLMHPGPINRGVELESELADSVYSVIDEQVTNGVAVRMSLLYFLAGGKDEQITD